MNTKKLFLGIILGVLVCVGITAQGKPQILVNLNRVDGQSGKIEVIQSEQIENLLRMQIHSNRLQEGIPGYRILIFSQSGQTARDRSNSARSSFVGSFPDIKTYQQYNAPNFQILVGNFRTKNEALRELKQIERIFPRAYIVTATIQTSNQ